jgi:hypothetical protein
MAKSEKQRSWIAQIRGYQLENMEATYAGYDHTTGEMIKTSSGFNACVKLNETYEAIKTPPGIKIPLLPHQCTTVRAMLDLELKRHITVHMDATEGEEFFASDKMVIETSAAILSEKLGSGKTLCILSLIRMAKDITMPKIANITDLNLPCRDKALKLKAFKSRGTYKHIGWKTEIRRTYNKVIPLSVVFVAKSVILQWARAISEQTDLKVFVIENIFHMKALYEMIFAPNKKNNINTLLKYDIILVKNGNISGQFDPPELKETHLDGVKNKPILSVFGILFKDYAFKRVVLDDFDTLGIPATAHTIPAMFTWFVSATKKQVIGGCKQYPAQNIQDAIGNSRPAYIQAWKNRTLFTFFNIVSEEKYVDQSTQASKVNFFVYKFINPNEQYIGLLGVMGTGDAQIVMEALNGDAINTAAGTVGLKSTSVADIFEKVLDNKWTIYKKNLEIEKYIERVNPFIDSLRQAEDRESNSATTMTKVTKNIKKPGPLTTLHSLVKFQDDLLVSTVAGINNENKASKEENGKAIGRVRDNLKQGDCPILGMPLKDGGVVIMKCCGVTISAEAASWSLKLQKTSTNVGDMAGSCPNCRQNIKFSQLIVVDRDINLDDIVNENVASEPEPEPEQDVTEDEETDPVDEFENEELNKYSCILRIIQGTDNGEDIDKIKTERNVHIPSMLVGNYDKGTAPAVDRKVLIYASYNETLEHITKRLIHAGIPYLRLNGTAHQIDDMVSRYNLPNSDPESVAVLLISGVQFCAGLNLQVTTDLIFPHKLVDGNVESQVGGRASRFGRSYNLRIHYVLYENEIHYMFMNKQVTVA